MPLYWPVDWEFHNQRGKQERLGAVAPPTTEDPVPKTGVHPTRTVSPRLFPRGVADCVTGRGNLSPVGQTSFATE